MSILTDSYSLRKLKAMPEKIQVAILEKLLEKLKVKVDKAAEILESTKTKLENMERKTKSGVSKSKPVKMSLKDITELATNVYEESGWSGVEELCRILDSRRQRVF